MSINDAFQGNLFANDFFASPLSRLVTKRGSTMLRSVILTQRYGAIFDVFLVNGSPSESQTARLTLRHRPTPASAALQIAPLLIYSQFDHRQRGGTLR